jgi:hypothetical protein
MRFTFKHEAIIMTVLFVAPMGFGLFVYFATFLFPRLAASSVTVSDLNIIKANTEMEHLFVDEAHRDGAIDALRNTSNGNSPEPKEVSNRREHLDQYVDRRKRLREELQKQPFVSIERGTYLRDVRKSAVRCDDDPLSARTFRLVQVVSGPNRGTLGWTCGPTTAIVAGPLPRLP